MVSIRSLRLDLAHRLRPTHRTRERLFVRAGTQVFHQAGICVAANTAKEDQIDIVIVRERLETVAEPNPATGTNRLGNYQLAFLSDL
jgi:hypothetical protein